MDNLVGNDRLGISGPTVLEWGAGGLLMAGVRTAMSFFAGRAMGSRLRDCISDWFEAVPGV